MLTVRLVALPVEAIGLRERAAHRVIGAIARSADQWIDEISTLPFDAGKLNKLKRVVINRHQMLGQ